MNQEEREKKTSNPEDISFGDIAISMRKAIKYIRHKWVTLLIISLAGALLGLCYSILKKPTYTAVCTFVLEDAKSSGGLSQYAGLASIAGINIGGNGGGIFEGDNILELYKSRTMIEKVLLSTSNFNGKDELLIDRYIDYNNLRNKWAKDIELKDIKFNSNPANFNRKQDSIITDLVELYNENNLNVLKPDKKLNIIRVEFTTKDELFSKIFTEKLVETVNDFYIKTKTKKSYQNVMILQHQSDSVRNILNASLNGVASAIDASPNANPLLSVLRVSSQKKQIDVQANTAIYSEIVKNLELEKINLRQETPLIQVIDEPVLPLAKYTVSKFKGILLGVLSGFILSVFIILISYLKTE